MNADFFWPSNPWQGGGFLLVLASCVVCVCVHACACVCVCVCVFVCVFRHDVREINCMLAGLIDAVMTSMDQKMPL